MKIGITARFELSPYGDLWFVFEQKLLCLIRDYLSKASIRLVTPENPPSIEELDLIVFTGGTNPGIELSRDSFEREIYDEGCRLNIPMLGICRGAQLFAFFSGVELTPVENHVGTIRQTKGNKSLGTCYHNWGISNLPSQWHILSRDSQDETVELFKHRDLPILGTLAHPERSSNSRVFIQELLNLIGL
jgi:gamma-glutamyl-gamma-aminobutyrate hydrolase PuuD